MGLGSSNRAIGPPSGTGLNPLPAPGLPGPAGGLERLPALLPSCTHGPAKNPEGS